MADLGQSLVRFADMVDRVSVRAGQLSSYLVIISILTITIAVVLRYFFNLTYVVMDEIQYYFYSIVFLFGFSYVFKEDGHIKVDILQGRLSQRKKSLINLLGTIFLAIPWTAVVCYYTFFYFLRSYKISERSTEATGLPAMYILKFMLFLAFVLLLFQALAKAIRFSLMLRTPKPNQED